MVAKAKTARAAAAVQPAVVLTGVYLRECRMALGMSQAAIARRIPVHTHTWGCWERDVYPVPVWQYTRILDELLEAKRERLERIFGTVTTAAG